MSLGNRTFIAILSLDSKSFGSTLAENGTTKYKSYQIGSRIDCTMLACVKLDQSEHCCQCISCYFRRSPVLLCPLVSIQMACFCEFEAYRCNQLNVRVVCVSC